MSPPIYTPDGSEVSEIVLPDGSTASEVIGPDGNVVFEAGPDIRDSDIANFESGSLDPSFNGATGDYEVSSTSPTLTGTFSLKGTVTAPGRITSETGLDTYPQQGQRFACYIYSGSTNNFAGPGLAWASQDADNMFFASYFPGIDELAIGKYENGTRSEITARANVSTQRSEWYDLEIEWTTSGGITVRIFDVDQTTGDRQGSALGTNSTTDTTYTSGGIGFLVDASSEQPRYDNYRVLENL